MPTINFIEFGGAERKIDAALGESIMVAATSNLIPGIDADCGGECSCATCHVLIDKDWRAKLPPISDTENSMLDLNPDRTEDSRLSCQLKMTEALDGIVVRLPEFQY